MNDLRRERGMAMILITHDLGAVAGMADRIAVVYGGAIVEEGPVHDIFHNPLHPYTEGLLGSIPWMGITGDRLRPIEGDPPDLTELPRTAPSPSAAPMSSRPAGPTYLPGTGWVIDRCVASEPGCSSCAASVENERPRASQLSRDRHQPHFVDRD